MSGDGATIAAFSEEQVERLTKLKKSRLRYWERTGFFAPSLLKSAADRPIRVFSFRDIVALRILELLRVQNNVTLQHLRIVADKLRGAGVDKWINTTLYALNRKVVWVPDGAAKPEEVVSGQYVIGIPLRRIVSDTQADLRSIRRRRDEDYGVVKSIQGVSGGPVLAGTRIRVGSIQRLVEDGFSTERILEEYPDLMIEDVEAAMRFSKAVA